MNVSFIIILNVPPIQVVRTLQKMSILRIHIHRALGARNFFREKRLIPTNKADIKRMIPGKQTVTTAKPMEDSVTTYQKLTARLRPSVTLG